MSISYFLGSNSKDGFFSLYDNFCRGSGDYLSIIKGGPGTGKSSFMKNIAAEAEKRGLEAEYVLCSGEPGSLDGFYIPALHRGWLDGTAPHSMDVRRFGIDSDYVNLGQFCDTPLPSESVDYVNHVYDSYGEEYSKAYACLSAAGKAEKNCSQPELDSTNHEKLRKRISGIIARSSKGKTLKGGRRDVFLRALCSRGDIRLDAEVNKLCKLIYQFDSALGLAEQALGIVREEAQKCGARLIVCHQPLIPEKYEAVILPELGIGFTDGTFAADNSRNIRVDALIPRETVQRCTPEFRDRAENVKKLEESAILHLKKANEIHDVIEKLYLERMDFEALNEFSRKYIEKIFK
ncbi:MAG: hypothetical protein ACOX68_06280 [Candidatus Limivicinus sp.]|jgi:hypothetical protein